MNHFTSTSYPSADKPDLLTGAPRKRQDVVTKAVGTEMVNGFLVRTGIMRDATSTRLNIKMPKAADTLNALTLKLFRSQLDELPEEVREHARMSFLIDQDVRRRDLQDFQCDMIFTLEQIVVEQMDARREDRSKFRIGGHDRGVFERFYRIEPMRYMSQPQFLTALRRSFGDEILAKTTSINKLYESFDMNRRDEMDWRSFLFLLTIVMQPFDDLQTHLRWAFAIYSSNGTLDFDNMKERMSLGAIKDMICSPILLCLRPDVCKILDDTWIALCVVDEDTEKLTQQHTGLMEEIKVPFTVFTKLVCSQPFCKFLQARAVFGKHDHRPWNYRLEAEYYHPMILKTIMRSRREARNDEEVKTFAKAVDRRIRRRHFERFVAFVRRREKVRRIFLVCSSNWRNIHQAVAFDLWRVTVLENAMVKQIQRVVRGFNARRRRELIKRINKRAVKMQAGFRSISKRKVFVQYNRKRQWAAVAIQRFVRARQARKRVISIIEAKFELGLRRIKQERDAFFKQHKVDAAILLQFFGRRFCVKMRIRRREELRRQLDILARKMDMEVERGRIENTVYRADLEQWFRKRKEEYDVNNVNEKNGRDALRGVIRYRKAIADAAQRDRDMRKEALMERQEEERIELWIKNWEDRIAQRVVDKGRQCNRCLILPETPEEIILSKDLKARIKAHSKVVLRRADKQKILMEIPEAEELAKKEIIDEEMEAERERAKEEMRAEATAGQAAIEAKKEAEVQQELRGRKRKKGWAAVKVQNFFRGIVARKKLRKNAYLRYKKHFDMASVTYYYEDVRTKRCVWSKPKSLGIYDIEADPGWVVLFDNLGEMFFYQPSTWRMSWTMPFMSQMCQRCGKDFAIARLGDAEKTRICEKCFNSHVAAELEMV